MFQCSNQSSSLTDFLTGVCTAYARQTHTSFSLNVLLKDYDTDSNTVCTISTWVLYCSINSTFLGMNSLPVLLGAGIQI